MSKRWLLLDLHTGQAIAGAEIVVSFDFSWEDGWSFKGTTNDKGIASFKIPRDYRDRMQIHVAGAGPYIRIGSLEDDPTVIRIARGGG